MIDIIDVNIFTEVDIVRWNLISLCTTYFSTTQNFSDRKLRRIIFCLWRSGPGARMRGARVSRRAWRFNASSISRRASSLWLEFFSPCGSDAFLRRSNKGGGREIDGPPRGPALRVGGETRGVPHFRFRRADACRRTCCLNRALGRRCHGRSSNDDKAPLHVHRPCGNENKYTAYRRRISETCRRDENQTDNGRRPESRDNAIRRNSPGSSTGRRMLLRSCRGVRMYICIALRWTRRVEGEGSFGERNYENVSKKKIIGIYNWHNNWWIRFWKSWFFFRILDGKRRGSTGYGGLDGLSKFYFPVIGRLMRYWINFIYCFYCYYYWKVIFEKAWRAHNGRRRVVQRRRRNIVGSKII